MRILETGLLGNAKKRQCSGVSGLLPLATGLTKHKEQQWTWV